MTATTIKIGLVTSVTGDASSTFSTAATGAKAYFDALNKSGGIDGRQVQLVTQDDTSSAAGAQTAIQALINDNVFAIISASSFFFGGYKAAQQAGVPVLGDAFDGPEWGQQPNTNMFSISGGVNANHSSVSAAIDGVQLFKSIGVSHIGGLAYGVSPSSISSIKDLKSAVADAGLAMSYENLSLPFGSADVSTPVLAMKNAGVDMAVCSCVQSTVLALVTGLKQAGSASKSLSYSSADSSLFSSATATQAAQGLYFASIIPPFELNNPATTTFAANIKAADPSYVNGTYPTFGITVSYESAALVEKGLQVAGHNPTRQSFITNLEKVTNWDADGLIASPVSFNHFGTSEKNYCTWYVRVNGNTFANVKGGNGSNGSFCANVPSGL